MNRLEQLRLLTKYTPTSRLETLRSASPHNTLLESLQMAQKQANNNAMTHYPMEGIGSKGSAAINYLNDVFSGTIAKNGLLELQQVAENARQNPQGLLDYFGPGGLAAKGAGLLGMIGGKNAKTADLAALAKAQEMKAQGIDADTIYQETKWWLDHPDGKPRFEIDDSGYNFNESKLPVENIRGTLFGSGKVADSVTHDELLNAYPSLKGVDNIDYNFPGKAQGEYKRAGLIPESITLWRGQDKPSTMLHELQHATQQREGFASGSNESMFKRVKSPKWAENEKEVIRFNELKDSTKRLEEIEKSNKAFQDHSKKLDILNEMQEAGKITDDEWAEQTQRIFDEFQQWKKINTPLSNEADEIYKRLGPEFISPTQQYHRTAGEAEARLVQQRMNMNMLERLRNPFYKNYDVPLEDQIIRY